MGWIVSGIVVPAQEDRIAAGNRLCTQSRFIRRARRQSVDPAPDAPVSPTYSDSARRRPTRRGGPAHLTARLLLIFPLLTAGAHAADERREDWFTVMLENDIFAGKDNGYTNGIGVSWAQAGFTEFGPDNIPAWMYALSKGLYISTSSGKQRAVSYSISQLMQTPSDIRVPALTENEAPYAGLLLWFGNLHAFDDRVADRLSLGLGVVGPLSGAEHTQTWVHRLIESDEPQGWDNQIHNEPVFQVSAERLLRLADCPAGKTADMDVIGSGNIAVGTLESYAALGIGVRLGRGLDRSFPTADFLPGRQVNPLAGNVAGGWYVFANIQGRFVANDISIDGNTFKESHSARLEHWQAAASTGAAYGFERWAFMVSAQVATDRFEGQPDTTRFGSLSVTYNY